MVTNAGVLRDRVLWNMSDEDFDAVVQRAPARHVHLRPRGGRRFREQGEGGRLILVGSPAGQCGNFGQTNYAAAKAGIVAIARTWALELARAPGHGQRRGPDRLDAMTETIPFYAPSSSGRRTALPLPRCAPGAALGHARGLRRR